MSLLKKVSRELLFPLAVKTLKLHKFILSKSKNNYLIVNFHGVTDLKGHRFNNRHLDVGDFEKMLDYLKANFNIVKLSEIFEMHEKKVIPSKKTIALTFDDGYLNNFETALPVLKSKNIPATFYVISKGLIDSGFYVWPDIVELTQKFAKEDLVLDKHVFKYPEYFCAELNVGIIDFLRGKGKDRMVYIKEISEKYPFWKDAVKNYPQLIELTRKEVLKKYANETLLEIGSHSHSHFNLEHLSDEDCELELKESYKIIEECTGKKPVSIAFPDGSYNKQTLEIAFKTGYKNLVAVDYLFNENNSVKGLLSRFTISNSTTPESNLIRLARQFDKFGF